jgi:peptidoglycan/LPS O-acetylase OafA/YrhL
MNKSTSLYLDLVRPLAAIVVLLSHVCLVAAGRLDAFSGYGSQAVDVFFVLSGFVIAHVSSNRENDWKSYSFSRFARIYSVAIPAIVVTFVFDNIGVWLNPSLYVAHYQGFGIGPIVRSVLFLNEQWNVHRFPGSNGPYWSLGFEVWFYIIFGALLFTPRFFKFAVVALLSIFIGPKVLLMAPAWLLGFVSYKIVQSKSIPPIALLALLIVPVLMVALFEVKTPSYDYAMPFEALDGSASRWMSLAQDYFLSIMFAMHLIGFGGISGSFEAALAKFERPIRWISGATFSIYLFHFPVMKCLAIIVAPEQSAARFGALVIATIAVCFLLAELSERRKAMWRNAIEYVARNVASRRSPDSHLPAESFADGLSHRGDRADEDAEYERSKTRECQIKR